MYSIDIFFLEGKGGSGLCDLLNMGKGRGTNCLFFIFIFFTFYYIMYIDKKKHAMLKPFNVYTGICVVIPFTVLTNLD